MKKYKLTILYDENSDIVEYIEEEIEDELSNDIEFSDIKKLTIKDIELIMEDKDYAKA